MSKKIFFTIILAACVLLAISFPVFKNKKKQKSFIMINGEKKPLTKTIKDQIKNQINNINIPENTTTSNNKTGSQSTFDTINEVQKINKFNKK